ncbi:hypothetical protein [Rhizobium sp. RU20A]|uniref:hypothetical protein n=1 Tax=Rhizobium sp. RU20A TaxID=1907412 RepID=UPI001FCEEC9F|nr:hypothetical protein [Rhizobium sp. RU20A]
MMMAVLIAVYLRNRLETGRLPSILTLYFVGGAIAWIPAQIVARLAAGRARQETRFAAQFVSLTLFTIGFTALIFALDYRGFYAQWHAPTFTYIWFLQQFYTIGGATYQFAVIGLPLFLPVGLPLLIVTSLWQARDIS